MRCNVLSEYYDTKASNEIAAECFVYSFEDDLLKQSLPLFFRKAKNRFQLSTQQFKLFYKEIQELFQKIAKKNIYFYSND